VPRAPCLPRGAASTVCRVREERVALCRHAANCDTHWTMAGSYRGAPTSECCFPASAAQRPPKRRFRTSSRVRWARRSAPAAVGEHRCGIVLALLAGKGRCSTVRKRVGLVTVPLKRGGGRRVRRCPACPFGPSGLTAPARRVRSPCTAVRSVSACTSTNFLVDNRRIPSYNPPAVDVGRTTGVCLGVLAWRGDRQTDRPRRSWKS